MNEAPPVSLKTRLLAAFIRGVIFCVGSTCRVTVVVGAEQAKALQGDGPPQILSFWHNRLVYMAHYLARNAVRKGARFTILSGLSKDGDIGATIGQQIGVEVARGSATKQSVSGLKALCRTLMRDGRSVIISPDGSKGPVYTAKIGVVALAKLTGAPVVPMSYWADRYWRLKSWDRLVIPKPFARIAIAVGQPIYVARDCDEAALEDKRREVEQAMDAMGFAAEKAFAPKA